MSRKLPEISKNDVQSSDLSRQNQTLTYVSAWIKGIVANFKIYLFFVDMSYSKWK